MEINDEMKQKMLEYLQTFEAGIRQAGEFSAEQAPLVVQEFLAWEFWGSVFIAVGFFLAFITSLCVVVIAFKRGDERDRLPIGLLGGAVVLGFLFVCADSCFCACKVAVAPRLVVLEKISSLMR